MYIGETGRNLTTRSKEHTTKNSKTAIGNHSREHNHRNYNIQTITHIQDPALRKIIEMAHIKLFKPPLNEINDLRTYINLDFCNTLYKIPQMCVTNTEQHPSPTSLSSSFAAALPPSSNLASPQRPNVHRAFAS